MIKISIKKREEQKKKKNTTRHYEMTIKVYILPKHQSIVQSSDRVIGKLTNNKHPHIYH